MERGYIKLYRKTFDHWMWDDSPKSKFEAWILLLKMANHEAKKISLGNQLINVLPGDVITSEVKLSGCLKWSRSKLRSFLQTLEDDKMIVRKKDSKKTVLTICNYDKYHSKPKDKKTEEKPEKNSERTAKEHNEELKALREQIRILKETVPDEPADPPKKPKNPKEEIIYPPWLNQELFNGFLEDRKTRKVANTTRAIKGLITALDKACGGNYYLQAQIIDKAITNTWKSFFALRPDEIVPEFELDGRGLPVEMPYVVDMDAIAKIKAERDNK